MKKALFFVSMALALLALCQCKKRSPFLSALEKISPSDLKQEGNASCSPCIHIKGIAEDFLFEFDYREEGILNDKKTNGEGVEDSFSDEEQEYIETRFGPSLNTKLEYSQLNLD